MKTKKLFILIIVSILVVLNGILNLNVLNLGVTLPEYLLVLFLLTQKKTKEALLWHTIFFITSYNNIFTEKFMLLNFIDSNFSFNYANFSFHGLRYSLIITYIIIVAQSTRKRITTAAKQTVFYKLYKFLLYCVSVGLILGVFGLAVLDYSFNNFTTYGYYGLLCFGFTRAFLYEYDTDLKEILYDLFPFIITIAVVFEFICIVLGLRDDLIVVGSSGIFVYCFLLIPSLLFYKKSIPILIVLGLSLFVMINDTSGKMIYSMIFMFISTVVLSFSKNVRGTIGLFNQSKIILILIVVLAGYPLLKQTMFSNAEDMEHSNLEFKMNSVESLTNFFMGKGNMDDVAASPYIRLAEFSNIVYEDIRNPLFLTLGRGYGGYYEDHLGLFNGYDIASGAFSIEQVRTGKFSSGHDSFVTVPMLNGFIGFFMMMSLIVTMCRRSYQNYLYLSCLLFLMLWFYFDVLMGIMGVMLLYAAEHRIIKT